MNQFTKKERRNFAVTKAILIIAILLSCALPFQEKIWESLTSWTAKGVTVHALPIESVTVSSQLPATPTNIRLLGVSDDGFHVEWNGDDKATHYRYYINGKEMGTTPWNGYVQSELEADTVYEFGVRSENLYGQSETVTLTLVTQEDSALEKPKNIHKTGDIVSWDAVKDATHYVVTSYGVIVYEGTENTFTHPVSKSGLTEHYFVQAANEVTESTSANTLVSFDSTGYFMPTVPHEWVLSAKGDTLSMGWTKGVGATETVVYLNDKVVYQGNGTNVTLHDIKGDEWYTIALHSTNPIGESEIINLRIQPNDFADN